MNATSPGTPDLSARDGSGIVPRVMRNRAKTADWGGMRRSIPRWVLAMLCLRALLPAGFMLAGGDGRLAVVLCDSDARSAAHHRHGHQHPGHAHLDPTCPYAQSAGPAPLPALPVLPAAPIATALRLPRAASQTWVPFGPSRQQSPRAPPHLA